jgi:O-antigen/teichoic acid export membrane protein
MLWASVGAALSLSPATYLRAAQRPIAASVLQLGQFLLGVSAGIVLVAVLGRGLRGAIEGLAVAGVLNGLIGLVFAQLSMPGRLTLPIAREAIVFSLPFVPHITALQISQASDRWIMKGVGREQELGVFALAGQLTAPTGMVVQAWNESYAPQQGEQFRAGGAKALASSLWRAHLTYFLATLVPGALTVIGLPALRWIVGARFSSSLWPVPLLLVVQLVDSAYYPPINVLFYLNRSRSIPAITIATAAVNALMNLLLVPLFGIWGALGARMLSSVVRSGLSAWMVRRALRLAEAGDVVAAASD